MNRKPHKPRKHKWTKQAVLEASRRFTSWRDFRFCCHEAYRNALQYADEITWLEHLKRPSGFWTRERVFACARAYTTPMHTVYKYVFPRQHAVYIGLTIDPIGRDNHHRHGHRGKVSAVLRFAWQHCEQVPRMLIIAEHLTISEAQACEDVLVKANRKRGWLVLNKGATGVGCGSIGSCAHRRRAR